MLSGCQVAVHKIIQRVSLCDKGGGSFPLILQWIDRLAIADPAMWREQFRAMFYG